MPRKCQDCLSLRSPALRLFDGRRRARQISPVARNRSIYTLLYARHQWCFVQSFTYIPTGNNVQHAIYGCSSAALHAVRGYGPERLLSLRGGQAGPVEDPLPLKWHNIQPAPAIQPAYAHGERRSEPSRAVEYDECALFGNRVVVRHAFCSGYWAARRLSLL